MKINTHVILGKCWIDLLTYKTLNIKLNKKNLNIKLTK